MNDIKFAFRQLLKHPGFTTVAVLTLALGIGAGTAVFSLVNAILLRSLPVPNPHELRVLRWTGIDDRIPSQNGSLSLIGNRRTAEAVSHPLFLSLREQCAAQADIFGFQQRYVIARARGEAFTATGTMVSDNFFSALGVRPFIGRLLMPGEDYAGAGTRIVITYNWWERHFSLDPGVLGQAVTLNGTSFTVVGVLPRGFAGVRPGDPSEFYVPMSDQSQFLFNPITATRHWFVRLMARLKPGVSDAQLRAVLDVAFASEAGAVMKEPRMLIQPGHGGPDHDRSSYSKSLWLMLSVVGLVMLVACANIAGMSLARSTTRQHELAVRAALGAGRRRLIRQSLTESLVLALLGGGLGVMLAVWGKTAISRLLAGSADGLHYDLSLDFTVLGFSLAAALVTALLSGLLPALRAGRVDPVDGLKSRGALGAPRLRAGRVLVAAQVALSLLLLTGEGLYVRTLVNLIAIDAGFRTDKLLLLQVSGIAAGHEWTEHASFYERVRSSLATIPGVQGATLLDYPLLGGNGFAIIPSFPDAPATGKTVESFRVTVGDNFFETLGIPVLQGRGLNASDVEDAPNAVVVNETFVRTCLLGTYPLGLTVRCFGDWRIAGVCRDVKSLNLKEAAKPVVYFPIRQVIAIPSMQKNLGRMWFAARTALPPLAIVTAARKAVAAINPAVPVSNITTQEAVRDKTISQERLFLHSRDSSKASSTACNPMIHSRSSAPVSC